MSNEMANDGNPSHAITSLLVELRKGNKEAEKQLVPLIYRELHRLARHYMRGEREGHTLQTSALVNEAYMRLAGDHAVDWKNRAHFFGTAAHVMRRVLVDHARARDAQKRGGAAEKISLEDAFVYTEARHGKWLPCMKHSTGWMNGTSVNAASSNSASSADSMSKKPPKSWRFHLPR